MGCIHMTPRSIESHESTIKYFRTLGWTVNYDVYLRFDEDSVEYDSIYSAFACRPNAEEYGFVGHFETYVDMITSVSEWLVETVQGDRSA